MTNTMNINQGKAQFNRKEAKNFRAIMAKYYDARHKLNDETLLKNERVKALQTMLNNNNVQLNKMAEGTAIVGRTSEEIQTENAEFERKILQEKEDFKTLSAAQKKRFEDAESLCTQTLYETYKDAIKDSEKLSFFLNAIADFLTTNGVTAGMATCEMLARAVGRNNSTAKKGFKTGKLTVEYTFPAWKKLFLGTLADLMAEENVFNAYKYAYTLPEKRNK